LIYLDTSFVVSLYTKDSNSAASARTLQATRRPLMMSSLAELETTNALGLRVFRKDISKFEAAQSLRAFDEDLLRGGFLRNAIPESAFKRARELSLQTTAQLGVRTPDLLHVAAAIELGATTLYTFDVKQHRTARAAGLKVNPLA
jgi:predicted nucleic acid-binding protein